ncbi:MAG: hemolysin family protein [Promicromonosporaceae bacterium]|nr:hemolysin family protein [Promicromonosporaceae bacterium]
MNPPVAITIGVLLLLGNAFFVGADFAIISARRASIEPLAAAGNRRARTALWALEHLSLTMAAAQLGGTVCSVGLGIVAEPAVTALLVGPLTTAGLPAGLVTPISLVIALSLVVYLHVVLGELVPKNLAVAVPERAVLWLGPPLVLFARGVRPLIVALNWVANTVVRATGVEPRDEVSAAFTASEVQSIVEHSQAEGVLTDEQGLLGSAIEFSAHTAKDVMLGVDDLATVPTNVTPDEIERLVAKTGYSRFPVVEPLDSTTDKPVEIVGYLHLKDVLYATDEERHEPVPPWRVRTMATVAPDDEVEDALAEMQRSGTHLARVQQPGSGEVLGVIFLEDILEELVGEVRDAMQRRR